MSTRRFALSSTLWNITCIVRSDWHVQKSNSVTITTRFLRFRSIYCPIWFIIMCFTCSLLFCDNVLLCVTVFLLCIVLFIVLVLYCVCLWCTCCYPNWGYSVLFPQL
jgi:hypothetical protein